MVSMGEALKSCSNSSKFLLVGDNSFFKYQIKQKIAVNRRVIPVEEEDFENHRALFGNYVYNIRKVSDFKKWKDIGEISPDILILESDSLGSEFSKLSDFMVVNCFSPRIKDQQEDFHKRVLFYCKKREFKIDDNTVDYFFNRIGYDLFRLSNELTKLFIVCDEDRIINKEDIDALITREKEDDLFKLKKLINKQEVNIQELVPFSIKMTSILEVLITVKSNKNYFLLERYYGREFIEKEVVSLVDSTSVERFYDCYSTLTNILKKVRKKIFDINLIGQYELFKNF